MNISEELEAFLIEQYGEEPFLYEYTEQDLYEQIRKLVDEHLSGNLDIVEKGSLKKSHENYTCLQQDYALAVEKISKRESDIYFLKELLQRNNIQIPNFRLREITEI